MESSPQQTSLDIDALSSPITASNEDNPGISSLTWGWGTSTPSDCLPICIKRQSPPPARSPLNLGKTILGLTFKAVLAAFSDCLPICIKMQRPQPANSHQNLEKTILGLTFQAVLALLVSSPTTSPPLPTEIVLLGAAMLISFAVSFTARLLQNAFLKIALLFEKIGEYFAAIGVCIIPILLLVLCSNPPELRLDVLAGMSLLLATLYIISFKLF